MGCTKEVEQLHSLPSKEIGSFGKYKIWFQIGGFNVWIEKIALSIHLNKAKLIHLFNKRKL
jgi:hypothetical protein